MQKSTTHQQVSTYCRICEPQCALVAQVDAKKQEVVRLLPDKSHPVHKGFACHKGLNFTELHNDPDRLNYPQRRQSGTTNFERISWDDAAEEIAGRITGLSEKYGADALGFYVGNPSAFNSTGRDAVRKFARAVGTKYFFGSGTQDCSNKFAASEAVFGTANLHPIPDFKHTQYFLSLGSNPKISHVSFVHMTDPMGALRDIVSRGGKVVHVNPRKIESVTPNSGELLQIKPDTDVYLLAALIHEVRRAGLHDQAWIDEHARNIEPMWDYVAQFPAEKVADVVGVPAEQIRHIAAEFASADGASVHMSTGVNMGRQGTLAYWLVQMLSLITGNLGRRGGNLYSPGYFPAATVGKPKSDNPFFDTPFGELRTITGSLPGNLLADHIEQGLIKGLICMSGNPLLSMGGEERLQAAFKQLELVVVVDIYPSATSQTADYLLPATDWLERADINSVSLGFQPQPYVQFTDAVVPARFERRQEWWIFARLQQALGMRSPLDDAQHDLFARMDRQLEGCGLSMASLHRAPGQTAVLSEPEPELLFAQGVQLPERKIDCFPPLIQRGIHSSEGQFAELIGELEDAPLKLISLRTNYMVNSWLHNLPSLKRDHVLDNPLHIHPSDMQALNLTAEDEVTVSSAYGQVIANVVADTDLQPGVVAMTHGWGHAGNTRLSLASNHPGTNINAVLPTGPGSFDPLSNMSHMTGIKVEVQALA
ncbi:MAG: molybdopterin-dependent oxidoreductase [Pseudomonadota bacterium]